MRGPEPMFPRGKSSRTLRPQVADVSKQNPPRRAERPPSQRLARKLGHKNTGLGENIQPEIESVRVQKNSARDSVGCPGGGKEAIQHPLSTGSCNCQASEEESLDRFANPVGLCATTRQ